MKITGSHHFRSCNREQKDFWRSKFLELKDPTGYFFAQEYLEDGYRRWKSFTESHGVKQELREWMETLEVQLQAEAIVNIAKQKDSFQASRWLAEKGWTQKDDKRTKESKKKAEKVSEEIAEDMARLGFRVVK